MLGATIEVDTLDGKKKIEVPEGTPSRTKIRLKGLGVPHLRSNGRGDQYVEVVIDVPKRVSRSARKLLEELENELK